MDRVCLGVTALVLVSQGCDGFGVALRTLPVQQGALFARQSRNFGLSMGAVVDLTGDGGVTREMLKEGQGKGMVAGDIASVKYTGKVVETGEIFSAGERYMTTLEDGTMISGWDTGLSGLKPGDRAIIRCNSRYGYGDEGVTPVIPPQAALEFDLELIQNEGNIMNPATFVDSNPLMPRTPDAIAEAFDNRIRRKMALEADKEELEGLDKFIAWVKTIYIFGLFESETGQEAPWYLKPLITFPIMISICGLAFYVVFALDGITTDRGTGVQDDPMLSSTIQYVDSILRA